MSHINASPRSILFQNDEGTITLLDIPRSISEGQGTLTTPCTDVLHSSSPLEKPYPSIEPQSQKARQKVEARLQLGDEPHMTFPQDFLVQGLAIIRAAGIGGFCAERIPTNRAPTGNVQDQLGSETLQPIEGQIEGSDTEEYSVGEPFVIRPARGPQKPLVLSSSAPSDIYEVVHMIDIVNRAVRNPFSQPAKILVSDNGQKYRIPPSSTFVLSKVGHQEATLFSNAAYKLLPEPSISAAPGQFNFVLLDPPWENRSVRRSKKYEMQRKAEDNPLNVLQETLGKHIAPRGLVACWITNKKSVRDSALQAFDTWGVELVEEWAWLKTTMHGDPICAVDGIMRRPYELLLVGRSFNPALDGFEHSESTELTRKRLIVGVPDLHSRKPCLKSLIEPMMANRSDYRALEIFARNLTAGWWSWGDEVLKYNWEGCWTRIEPLDNM
ncbi:MAG: hypothetical protein Q9170_005786 [Blastenia crenularia]